MPLSSLLSPDQHDGLLRRFLVVARRGEIVALINGAHSEGDLGAAVATELCEAYDAEIGFVLIARPGSTAELIGRVGLIGADPATVLAEPSCSKALSGAMTVTERGTDLLGLGIRDLALAPRTAGGARLLVGVGRLYDQHYDCLELALLEAVTKSTAQALERFGLERQLQQAHEVNAAQLPLPVDAQLGSLVDIFRLLGHPIRLRILVALGSETLSPSELDERLDIGLGSLAYHVGVLRDDGLLMLVETRASRGALESFYRLTERGEFARSVIAATWREMSGIAER